MALLDPLIFLAGLLLAALASVGATHVLCRNITLREWRDLPGSGRFILGVAIVFLGTTAGVYRFGAQAYAGFVLVIFGAFCVISGVLVGALTHAGMPNAPAKNRQWLRGSLTLFCGGLTVAILGFMLT